MRKQNGIITLEDNARAEDVFPHIPMLKCGAFERWLDQDGRALMNGIRALVRDPRELPSLFCHVKTL